MPIAVKSDRTLPKNYKSYLKRELPENTSVALNDAGERDRPSSIAFYLM